LCAYGQVEVDIQSHCSIDLSELPIGGHTLKAVIADQLAHNRAILLFHKALIVLLSDTTACEGQFLAGTIREQLSIEELGTIGCTKTATSSLKMVAICCWSFQETTSTSRISAVTEIVCLVNALLGGQRLRDRLLSI
jgi:hypothetical protein